VAPTGQREKCMRVEFNQSGTWAALDAARSWCHENRISVGQSCATGPSGLLFGKFWIAKWRNLTQDERNALHGTMSGDFREGPVVIILNDGAVAAHMACINAQQPARA
jgi:hypothetical protein